MFLKTKQQFCFDCLPLWLPFLVLKYRFVSVLSPLCVQSFLQSNIGKSSSGFTENMMALCKLLQDLLQLFKPELMALNYHLCLFGVFENGLELPGSHPIIAF